MRCSATTGTIATFLLLLLKTCMHMPYIDGDGAPDWTLIYPSYVCPVSRDSTLKTISTPLPIVRHRVDSTKGFPFVGLPLDDFDGN